MSTLNTTTVATRPTTLNNTTDVGKSYFETDSNKILVWDGSLFNEWNADYSSFNSLSAAFDGVNDFINCGSDSGLNLTSGFTLSAWIKQSTVKDNTVLFRRSGANGFQVRLNSGTFNYYGGGGDRNFTTGLTSTTDWYHLVVTHTGSSVSGYVDGSQAGSSISDSIISVASTAFSIGKHNLAATGRYFAGNIDEVAVWSSALSSSEVSEIYNTGSPIDLTSDTGNYSSSSNLVGYWRMGDGSGDTTSGGGTPADSSTVGTVKNIANPGTHDGAGTSGTTFSSTTPQ